MCFAGKYLQVDVLPNHIAAASSKFRALYCLKQDIVNVSSILLFKDTALYHLTVEPQQFPEEPSIVNISCILLFKATALYHLTVEP